MSEYFVCNLPSNPSFKKSLTLSERLKGFYCRQKMSAIVSFQIFLSLISLFTIIILGKTKSSINSIGLFCNTKYSSNPCLIINFRPWNSISNAKSSNFSAILAFSNLLQNRLNFQSMIGSIYCSSSASMSTNSIGRPSIIALDIRSFEFSFL